MPILDNGQPLKMQECPRCGSQAISYNPKAEEEDVADCKNCIWKGNQNQLKTVKYV